MPKLELDNKDRAALALAGFFVFIVVMMLLWIPSGPRAGYIESRNKLQSLNNDLQMAQLLKAEQEIALESQKELMQRLKARPGSFNFFTFLERKLTEADLKSRSRITKEQSRDVSDLQPRVALHLEGVSLEELVDFLHSVYSSNNLVAMHRMNRLRPSRTGQGLECEITLTTIVKS